MNKIKGVWQGLITVELEFEKDDVIYPLNELNRRLREMFTDEIKEVLNVNFTPEGTIKISNVDIQDFVESNE